MRRYALVSGGDDRHPEKNAIQRASGGAVPAGQMSVLLEEEPMQSGNSLQVFFCTGLKMFDF
jgi:hypothetical protein